MANALLDNESVASAPASSKSILFVDSVTGKECLLDSSGIVHGRLSSNILTSAMSTLSGAVDTYITNSNLAIPTAGVQVGQHYRWWLHASKTGAGVATPIYTFRFGSGLSTSDTAVLQLTAGAQTGVTDSALFLFSLMIQTSGASAAGAGQMALDNLKGAAVGFGSTVIGTFSAINLTGAGNSMGISINPGASAAWTVTSVIAELVA